MFNIKIFVLAVMVFVALPQVSLAYFTTNQTVTQINAETILYSLEYKFGMEKYDLKMPIGALRGLEFGNSSPYLGYNLMAKDEVYLSGDTRALVLSTAKIVGNEYFVPKGEAATFTLYVLAKFPLATVEKKVDRVAVQVTSLPFSMLEGEVLTAGKLNPSELQYYITPEVKVK